MLIVFIDGFLGSYYLGAVSGFQLYMLGAIIYPWLAPFIGQRLKLTYTALGTLAFAGLCVWASYMSRRIRSLGPCRRSSPR